MTFERGDTLPIEGTGSSPPTPEAEGALTRASELALTFAQLVTRTEAFPSEAAEDLARLLGHSLAFETPAQRRHGNLGLLLDLIAEGTGEFITTTRYMECREAARARGESWPTAAQLATYYGGWLRAVNAAARFWFDGGPARVAVNHNHARRHPGYAPDAIIRFILRARNDLEVWPTEPELELYGQALSRLRRGGEGDPIPAMKQIRKAFGTVDAALQAARRVAATG